MYHCRGKLLNYLFHCRGILMQNLYHCRGKCMKMYQRLYQHLKNCLNLQNGFNLFTFSHATHILRNCIHC